MTDLFFGPQPLEMFTVFFNPSDYPGKYVVRRFLITAGKVTADPAPRAIEDTLEASRGAIPGGLVCFDRSPEDEQQIVEVWM